MNHKPLRVYIQIGRNGRHLDVVRAMALADFQVRAARLIESRASRHVVMSVRFKGRTENEAQALSGVMAKFRQRGVQH